MSPAASSHASYQLRNDTAPELKVVDEQRLESARYAVLRRIGPALRHHIAGALQPVSMMASMLERRAQMDTPDTATLRKNCTEMSGLSRAAGTECVGLIGWVAPPEGAQVELSEGVADCVSLLSTDFSFRGFSIVTVTSQCGLMISQAAIRAVVPAALIALSDAAGQSARFEVSASAVDGTGHVSVAMKATPGESLPSKARSYRSLAWSEVEVLAASEHVALTLNEEGVHLAFETLESELMIGDDVRWG